MNVETITRIRNTYLDAQYRTQNSALSKATTQAEELGQAQSTFNEPSDSGDREPALDVLERLEQPQPTHRPAKRPSRAWSPPANSWRGSFNELSAQLSTISSQADANSTTR